MGFSIIDRCARVPSDFSHVKNDYQRIITYIKKGGTKGLQGMNVLIYGEPGNGKTEMARIKWRSICWRRIRRFDLVLEIPELNQTSRLTIARQILEGLPVTEVWLMSVSDRKGGFMPRIWLRRHQLGYRKTVRVEAEIDAILASLYQALGYREEKKKPTTQTRFYNPAFSVYLTDKDVERYHGNYLICATPYTERLTRLFIRLRDADPGLLDIQRSLVFYQSMVSAINAAQHANNTVSDTLTLMTATAARAAMEDWQSKEQNDMGCDDDLT